MYRNLTVSAKTRITITLITAFRHISSDIFYTVWGIVYYSSLGFVRTSVQINEQLHTFFLHINSREGVDTVHCCLTMTIKEQALLQAIKHAVSNYDSFYKGEVKLEIKSISDVQVPECVYYPSEGLDVSNLEKCTGGRCRASFRVAYRPNGEDNLIMEERISCENIFFDVVDYKEEEFTVKISNKTLTL